MIWLGNGPRVEAGDSPGELAGRPALVGAGWSVTFAELEARANRLARALRRRGLRAGDGLALISRNRQEFAEVVLAARRTGLRLTPVNWHLAPDEIAFIVEDCEARLVIADRPPDPTFGESGRATTISTKSSEWRDMVAAEDGSPLEDPVKGTTMLYTSGTSGRPKGVWRPGVTAPAPGSSAAVAADPSDPFGFGYVAGESVHLACGPWYHAAPLSLSLTLPLSRGVTVVVMDRFDAASALDAIGRHRVTHTFMVPTMFSRLLALPGEVRADADVSSLRHGVHAGAPCPVALKEAMWSWWGPVLWEFFSATEGFVCLCSPDEWRARPGTVGRPAPGQAEVRDETVWVKPPPPGGGRFEYWNDPGATAAAYDPMGEWFTVGDRGRLDEAGYLFITGRSSELVISGGVNIYPAEIDAALLAHAGVVDAASFGVPDQEWGERVEAVVELASGAALTGEDLVAWCRDRIAHFKCPRAVHVVDAVPRTESGKADRRALSATFGT